MPLSTTAVPAPLVDHVSSLDRPAPKALGPAFYDFPDTPLAQRAAEFVRSYLPAWAAHHSFRTYAFAIGIAHYAGWDAGEQAQKLGFDKELIFLACVLHEIGFNPDAQKSPMSLELWGAIKARQWLLDQTAQVVEECRGSQTADNLAVWADEVCEAIARHTIEFRDFSSRVRLTGALVSLGAGQDLMGLSARFVNQEDVISICERWPRLGYCDGLKAVAEVEVANKPACLFEDCTGAFDPGMYSVDCFDGLQGELEKVVS